MAVGREQFEDLLRTDVAPKLQKWILGAVELSPYFTSVPVVRHAGESKKEVQITIKRVESYGPASEYSLLPESGQPGYYKFFYSFQKTAGRMIVSQDTLDLDKGKNINVSSFVDSLNGFKDGIRDMDECFLWGDGTGSVCKSDGTATLQVLTMENANWVKPGMTLVAVKGGVITGTNLVVDDVDPHGFDVTFAAGSDLTGIADATDFFIQGTYDDSLAAAPMGLKGHLSDTDPPGGAYQEKARASNRAMSPVIKTGATPGTPEDYSDIRFQSLFLACRRDFGKFIPEHGIYSPGAESQYVEWLKASNVPIDRMPAAYGYPESLYYVYAGKKVRFSSYLNMEPNKIYFPDKSTMRRYVAKQGGFWRPAGSIFIPVADQMVVQVVYYSHSGTACIFPKKQAVLEDVLENAL